MKHIDPNESNCSGCGLCADECPKKCISLITNSNGFQVACVELKNCVSCGLCVSVCPFYKAKLNRPIAAYALRSSSTTVVNNAASGGAFFVLAKSALSRGGVVYGVTDNCASGPFFMRGNSCRDLSLMQGSKYCYAELSPSIIGQITKDLISGTTVTFFGLPCQAYRIKNLFSAYSKQLTTVDLICQGAPSYKPLKMYRDEVGSKQGSTLIDHKFRIKDDSFQGYTAKLLFENGSELIQYGDLNMYNCSFSHKLFLREACYRCPFSRPDRCGDITIGDFWGIKQFFGEPPVNVSLLLVNSKNGLEYIRSLDKDDFLIEEHDIREAISGNTPLRKPCSRPKMRAVSYSLLERIGFSATVTFCYPKVIVKRVLQRKRRR